MLTSPIPQLDVRQVIVVPKCTSGNMSKDMLFLLAKVIDDGFERRIIKLNDIATKRALVIEHTGPRSGNNVIYSTLEVLPRHIHDVNGLLNLITQHKVTPQLPPIQPEVIN